MAVGPERVERAGGAGPGHLEDRAETELSGVLGGAVEVAVRSLQHTRGTRSSRPGVGRELIERRDGPEHRHLERRTAAEAAVAGRGGAARAGGAIEIAVTRLDQRGLRQRTVGRSPGKRVQHGQDPGWGDVEHDSAAPGTDARTTALLGGAIEIAVAPLDQ